MKSRLLWRVSITSSPEAEEAVSELLSGVLGGTASSYTNVRLQETKVSVFLTRRPKWLGSVQTQLKEGMEQMRLCGLNIGPARISLQKVPAQDWSESWKRHFQPLEIGGALLIKPSWSTRRPRAGQALVVLDPGLSFGTGQHPTTAYCLQQLVAHRQSGQCFLDVGTGSGILAIAAAKLGYAPIQALDFDPEAIVVARANARQNGVVAQIRFQQQDITKLKRARNSRYGLVCANLISNLLLAERDRLLEQLAPGGSLVVAGILKEEFPTVQAHYEHAGMRLVGSRAEREWRSGIFRKVGQA